MYKIEKNISLPNFRRWKYPFKEMEINDSFFVIQSLSDKKALSVTRRNLYNSARNYALKYNPAFKIAIRSRVENIETTKEKKEGLRVWRIE